MALTPAQLTTLQTDIDANSGVGGDFEQWVGDLSKIANQAIADAYNLQASPDFWVWEAEVSSEKTGMVLGLDDIGNLTTANTNRLSVSFQVRPGGFTPGIQSDRALFGDVFSVAGAVNTRLALLGAWQRLSTRAEKLFATGTGSEATGDLESDGTVQTGDPAVLDVVGNITQVDVSEARRLP